ncbi:MAG: DUF4304 domain-containing protein [Planctomycetes bacterium]|nr:DUF4304 domain-containing protein [Planctomycetota bacterium]
MARSRLETWADAALRPAFEARGFRRGRATRYARVAGLAVTHVLDLQASRWSAPGVTDFTINVGVHVTGWSRFYVGSADPRHLVAAECPIHLRIGYLLPAAGDVWWTLRGAPADEAVGEEVAAALLSGVEPFLAGFSRPEDVMAFLATDRPRSLRCVEPWPPPRPQLVLAAVQAALGDLDGASRSLAQAEALTRGNDVLAGWREDIRARIEAAQRGDLAT